MPEADAFAVTVAGTVRALSLGGAVEVRGRAVTLTIATAAREGEVVTVSYTVPSGPGAAPIRDGAHNEVAALSAHAVRNLTGDTAAPVLLRAKAESHRLVLVYDERLDESSVPGAGAFTVTVDGTARALSTSGAVTVRGREVTLNLRNVSTGQAVTVSYTPPVGAGAAPIRDEARNAAAAFTDHAVRNFFRDPRAPVLSGATVTGTALVLAYDEVLDDSSVPEAGAFAVTVAGAARALAETRPVVVSGMTVTLTLATPVLQGEAVTVSYEAPDGLLANPVQDLSDTPAAGFADRAVTNETGEPATGAPAITGTMQIGQTLTAGTGDMADADGLPDDFPDDYRFQWIRVDGATDTEIIGATSATYTLVAADQGKQIKVRVSFTDRAGNDEALTSDATAMIAAIPVIAIEAGASPVSEGADASFTLTRDGGDTTAALTVNVNVLDAAGDVVASGDEGARTVTFEAGESTAPLAVPTVDDDVDEINGQVLVLVLADDNQPAAWLAATANAAAVAVEDNDTRGVTLSVATLSVPEGGSAEYTVVLDSEPTGEVTVTPSLEAGGDVDLSLVSVAALTFTAENWDQRQTVTVRAAQDEDGRRGTARVMHTVAGADYGENGVAVALLTLTEVDDDELYPTVMLQLRGVDENGRTDQISETLDEFNLLYRDIVIAIGFNRRLQATLTADDFELTNAEFLRVVDRFCVRNATCVVFRPTGSAGDTVTIGFRDNASIPGGILGTVPVVPGINPGLRNPNATPPRATQWEGRVVATGSRNVGLRLILDNAETEPVTLRSVRVDFVFDELMPYRDAADRTGIPIADLFRVEDYDLEHVTTGTIRRVVEKRSVRHPFSRAVTIEREDISHVRGFDIPSTGIGGLSQTGMIYGVPGARQFRDSIVPEEDFEGSATIAVREGSVRSIEGGFSQAATLQVQVDTLAPVLRSAVVLESGRQLALTFHEAPDPATLPGAIDFRVSAGGEIVAISGAPALSGNVVTLNLATEVRGSQQVVAEYAGPYLDPVTSALSALQDAVENRVEAFTTGRRGVVAVTNNSTVNTPAVGGVTIIGEPFLGALLQADISTLSDADGLSDTGLSYQWLLVDLDGVSNETPLADATGSLYRPQPQTAGRRLRVRVSVTDDAGNTEGPFTSPATPIIESNSPASGTVTLAGLPRVGETLRANVADVVDADNYLDNDADNVPDRLTYEWARVVGGNELIIAGATASTYAPVPADIGHPVRVRVSFIDNLATRETLQSAPSAAVIQRAAEITIAADDTPVSEGANVVAAYTLTRVVRDPSEPLRVNLRVSETEDMVALVHEGEQTATFAPGETTATYSVAIDNDDVDEAHSDVTVTIVADTATPVTYTLGGADAATVTVEDDEADIAAEAVSVAVTSTPDASVGVYRAGDVVEFTYTFSRAVEVTGQPHFRFILDVVRSGFNNRTAEFARGSGSTQLVFAYTVQAGDYAPGGLRTSQGFNRTNPLVLEDEEFIRTVANQRDARTLTQQIFEQRAVLDFLDSGVDALAPTLTAATVTATGNTLILLYDEPLDAGALPEPTAYSIAIDGQTATAPTAVSVENERVTLTLPSTVTVGHTVTVAYTDPSDDDDENAISDAVGNDVASFAARTAVNESTVPSATGVPAITGFARVGLTLTAGAGTIADVDGLPATTFPAGYEFQWVREDEDGGNAADIAGATAQTYTPAVADEGKRIRVKVTFADAGGNDEERTSAATATVVAALAGICGRTQPVRDALVGRISGVTDCGEVTAAHLAAIDGRLFLNDRSITALAAGDFDGLTALDALHLDDNALTTLPAGVFDGLTALTELHLDENALTTLPAGVFDGLAALTELRLDNSALTTLPADVFDGLTALTELSLQHNALPTLPAEVFDGLTALTKLRLSDNALTTLPAEVFDGLTALTLLHLNDNALTTLPAGIFEALTALTDLRLQDNPGADFSPTAQAAPDDGTVLSAGGDATLDGSGSDGGPWGANVTYGWALTDPSSGVTVTFDDAAIATPVATIPALSAGTELTFTLTVTGRGADATRGAAPATDTATMTVNADATGAPTITGEARVGKTLTAGAGDIADDNGLPATTFPAGYEFQWSREDEDGGNPADIAGATARTYTLVAADEGKKVKVTVSFEDARGTDETRTSAATATVLPPLPGICGRTQPVRDALVRLISSVTDCADVTAAHLAVIGGRLFLTDRVTVTDVNEPPSAPAAPRVTATAGETTSLDVSWTAPANDGKPAIDHYDLRYCPGLPADCVADRAFTAGPQNVSGTSSAIDSLTAGTTYQVQVRATNPEGDSVWSASPTH